MGPSGLMRLVWTGGTWSGGTECDDEKVNEGDGGEVSGFEEQISWPGTECDDEKVNEGDGGEVSGFEEQISWPRHTLVVSENEEKGRKEWNGEHEAVEEEREGLQGPKLEVALELWEEDEMKKEWVPVPVVDDASILYKQKESEKLPQLGPKVEELEAM
eukprot:s4265_g3.t1